MEVVEGKLRPMLPHEDNDQLGELINLVSQSWDQDASAGPSFARIASAFVSSRSSRRCHDFCFQSVARCIAIATPSEVQIGPRPVREHIA
ncbi:hypothetical protein OIU79_011696 [Salix purpurea]|uniref:Uncharacterized protein n=1 Tax=Salix purpurea TaxID=77065 RepID=A0A9Q0Q1Y8_SALPP|nr:hypothetical protein OIU79_011696 [Salix purpurea]